MISFNPVEVEELIKEAVSACYSKTREFQNETIFKYELFHQIATRKLNGIGLAKQLPWTSTCILHAEAKAYNGQAGYLNSFGISTKAQADLLLCNPYGNNSSCGEFGRYNYKPEVIIELKLKYSPAETRKIIQSYAPYLNHFSFNGSFFIIYANDCHVDTEYIQKLENEFQLPIRIKAICRNSFQTIIHSPSINPLELPLEDKDIFDCFNEAFKLYGYSWKKTEKAFYWRNCQQQGELDKEYTFPCEGDFNAHLYHILKTKLSEKVKIFAEVKPGSGSNKRIDLSIETANQIYFIEVKMNWDQFRKGCEPPLNIVDKFKLIDKNAYPKPHRNMILMIQGDPHKKHNMDRALEAFKNQDFTLIRYSESCRKMEIYNPVDAIQEQLSLVH